MTGLLVRIVVNGAALFIVTRLMPELSFGDSVDLPSIAGVAIVFGVVNAFVRPVLKILTFPLSMVTFGLFGVIVNALLLLLVAAVSDAVGLDFTVGGFPPELGLNAFWWAIVGSVALGIVSTILGLLPLPGDQ